MRDRLIELLKLADKYASGVCTDYDEAQEVCADFLLAEGVIVPPCKVGQAVYYPIRHTNEVVQLFVREIVYAGGKIKFYASYLAFTADNIGKTVFLTREQAEKALAERGERE